MYTKLEKKTDSEVTFYLTSLDNSPGFYDFLWEDGKEFQLTTRKNAVVKCNIETQVTHYLEKNHKCQKEAFYKCIASVIDANEFNECSNKCMPNIFANIGKNYTTPFCQNDTQNELCIVEYIDKVGYTCKKSCSIKEYIGGIYQSNPLTSDKKDQDLFYFKYRLYHLATTKVHEEYLIYDEIGMVGSVGGTLGMFLNFELLNFFSYFEL